MIDPCADMGMGMGMTPPPPPPPPGAVPAQTAEECDRAFAMAIAEQELAQEQMQEEAQRVAVWGAPAVAHGVAEGVVVELGNEYEAAAALVRQYSSNTMGPPPPRPG